MQFAQFYLKREMKTIQFSKSDGCHGGYTYIYRWKREAYGHVSRRILQSGLMLAFPSSEHRDMIFRTIEGGPYILYVGSILEFHTSGNISGKFRFGEGKSEC